MSDTVTLLVEEFPRGMVEHDLYLNADIIHLNPSESFDVAPDWRFCDDRGHCCDYRPTVDVPMGIAEYRDGDRLRVTVELIRGGADE
ncbi:hypothetical protein AAK967_02330 [Atopobiaceae bacterium 24-176]